MSEHLPGTFTFFLVFSTNTSRALRQAPAPDRMRCRCVDPRHQNYAGQLVDPMSHLSFVLSFILLESGLFVYFLLCVAVGIVAKESVVAMLGYYLLFHRHRETHFWKKFAVASLVCGAVLVGSRLLVLERGFGYTDISGVGVGHSKDNLMQYGEWGIPLLLAVGSFLPFVVLGWRHAHPTLRRLTVYLLPALFLSSTVSSWLHEVRNFVPSSFHGGDSGLPLASRTEDDRAGAAQHGRLASTVHRSNSDTHRKHVPSATRRLP